MKKESVLSKVMQCSTKTKVTMGVLAVLVVAAIVAWIYQLVTGMGVTGMSNATSWGMYIIMFMFFVGLAAGSMIVASAGHVFNVDWLKKATLPATIVALAGICAGGISILIDLGGFARIWRMVTGPNPLSPLFWDMCGITVFLIVAIVLLVFLVKGNERNVTLTCRVALPVAVLVLCVDAWIFGLQEARAWYSAIMAPIFVASGLDSSLSLIMIVLGVLKRAGIYEVGKEAFNKLGGLLVTFIAVDGFLIGCEVLTMAYPGSGEAAALSQMLFGATAPFFWIEVIGGLIVPFLILIFAKNRQSTGSLMIASGLVIVGVFCKRVWLLLTSFITPNVDGALGITLGTQSAQTGGVMSMWATQGLYMPSAIEVLILVGGCAFMALAIMVLCKIFVTEK